MKMLHKRWLSMIYIILLCGTMFCDDFSNGSISPAPEVTSDAFLTQQQTTFSAETDCSMNVTCRSATTRQAWARLDQFTWTLEGVINPFIMILGITGNVLTVTIMTQKPFSALTVSMLLTALALSDTATLIMFSFNKQTIRRILGTDVRAVSDNGCKVFFWSFRLSKITSSWLLVLITLERFAAVWLPTQSKRIATRRNALIAIWSVIGFLGVYIGVWASFTDRIINGKCIPNAHTPATKSRTVAFLIFGLSLLSFIPALILLVLNSMIAQRLWARYKIKPGQPTQKTEVNSKATLMLLGVALAFLVLITPIAVAHLVFHILDKNIFEATDPAMVVFREVAQVLELMNSSINFYLYVLCSRGFRRMLLKVLCQRWKFNAVHPSTNTAEPSPT